jgi:hypothetical protein
MFTLGIVVLWFVNICRYRFEAEIVNVHVFNSLDTVDHR